jgi:hypothetical protein
MFSAFEVLAKIVDATAKLFVPVAKLVAWMRPTRLVSWWNSGTPTARLHRALRAIALLGATVCALAVGLAGVALKLWSQGQSIAALKQLEEGISHRCIQMSGESLALDASYHLNSADYCRILHESRPDAGHFQQASDHSALALKYANEAISVLGSIDDAAGLPASVLGSIDEAAGLPAWQLLQLQNHLALAYSIKGFVLADREGRKNLDAAKLALIAGREEYRKLREIRNALNKADEASLAESLPALERDVQWYQALNAAVTARITLDQGDLGQAFEQVHAIRDQFRNICPIEQNRRFRWVLEQFPAATRLQKLPARIDRSHSRGGVAENPGNGGGKKLQSDPENPSSSGGKKAVGTLAENPGNGGGKKLQSDPDNPGSDGGKNVAGALV